MPDFIYKVNDKYAVVYGHPAEIVAAVKQLEAQGHTVTQIGHTYGRLNHREFLQGYGTNSKNPPKA